MINSFHSDFSEICDAYSRMLSIGESKGRSHRTVTAYHGSEKRFEEFDISRFDKGHSDGGSLGRGMYFADTKKLAKIWTHGDERYLYTVKIHFKNPYVMEDDGERKRFSKLIGSKYDRKTGKNRFDSDKMDEFSKKYDGVISRNEKWEGEDDGKKTVEYHTQYCVYDMDDIEILKVEKY